MKITTINQTKSTAGIAVNGVEVGYVLMSTGKFTVFRSELPSLVGYSAVMEAIDDHVALLMVTTRLTS